MSTLTSTQYADIVVKTIIEQNYDAAEIIRAVKTNVGESLTVREAELLKELDDVRTRLLKLGKI
jgi:hypothetical protein